MELEDLRKNLSAIDRQLVELIAKRQRIVGDIGKTKRDSGTGTRDYKREKAVLDMGRAQAEELGVEGASTMRRQDLLFSILRELAEDEEYDEKIISLNGKTFDILAYLALRKQRVFSKDEIINALWEEPEYVSDNTVEVAINQIRKRLKNILGFQVIHTVRRRGYKFAY